MNPPELIELTDYNGNWIEYETALYAIFKGELVNGNLAYDGVRIRYRKIPESKMRWASFWHLTQEGKIEDDRTPDLRRCERLRWVRWVIENARTCPEISQWENVRGTETSILLWYREEYLVVLSNRNDYLLLKTAYCTTQKGRIASLKKEREAFLMKDRNS